MALPWQQFFVKFMEAREAPLAGSAAIFEEVIPGRYDVIVASRDGGELARLENREVRGPLVAVSIPLPRQGVTIELRGARALGESPLTLRLDGEKEDRPFPRGGGTMDLPVLPGWHLVELRLGGTEVIYRGHLHLADDPATVLDLARLAAIDVARNSADAPLALRVSVFSREDPWKQAEVAFPLSDGRERSTIHWLMEPGTHPTVNGQHGYYYPHGEAGRKLEIGLGRLETLRVQVEEGASRGRTFLLGKIPGQDMIYWWGSQRPAPSGSTFEVPVECKLSAWALLQYEGRILTGAIVEDAPLRRGTCRVRVVRSNGWPIAGAEVSVRAKEIIGLDLQRYFEANDARSLFFTLGRGTTDESGMVELPIAEFPAMDLKATSGGRTATADIQPGQREILIEVKDA